MVSVEQETYRVSHLSNDVEGYVVPGTHVLALMIPEGRGHARCSHGATDDELKGLVGEILGLEAERPLKIVGSCWIFHIGQNRLVCKVEVIVEEGEARTYCDPHSFLRVAPG